MNKVLEIKFNNIRRVFFLLFAMLIVGVTKVNAQNCTVNAGIPQDFCSGNVVSLAGNSSGSIAVNASWSQIGGPSVIIDDPTNLSTTITGAVAGNTYEFRISATCQDGSAIFDDVTITMLPITVSNAGVDMAECPGTYTLSGIALGGGETGQWTIVGSNGANLSFNTPSSPVTDIVLPTNFSGSTIIRWTITNASNGCISSSDITVTNYGGLSPVSAGSDVTLSNCYTAFQSMNLNGSFAGNGTSGQIGTWNIVSGPNYPSFSNANANNSNISGLIEGTYVLEWTVVGPCSNGSDQVTITVPEATQDVTNAYAPDVVHCNPNTLVLLNGTPPSFANETVSWLQTSGPGATITSPTNPTTSVTGLVSPNDYNFTYTITNPVTGCTSSDNVLVRYRTNAPTIDAGVDTVFVCDDSLVSLPYTFTGDGSNSYQIISGPFTTGAFQGAGNPLSLNLNQEGTYTIRLKRETVGISCNIAFDDIIVIVGFAPTLSNAGTNQVLACGVTFTNLAANTPSVGEAVWSQVSGPNAATIALNTDPTTLISGLVSGVYTFKWLIASSPFCPQEENIVTVTVSSPIVAVAAGPDQTACENSPVTMSAGSLSFGETGMWTILPTGPIITDPTNPNTTITGMTSAVGTYTLTWTVSNGCPPNSDDVVITINNTNGASTADAGVDQCLANGTGAATLNGNAPIGAEIGLWSLISGPAGSSFTDATVSNTDLNVIVDGTYNLLWQIDLGGCQSTFDSLTVTIGTSGPANAGPDETVCYTGAYSLNASPTGAGIGSWSITGGPASASFANVNDPTTAVTFTDPGVYTFTWSINDGACATGSNTDDVQLSVSLQPSVSSAGPDQTICSGTSATLAANIPAIGNGSWSIVGAASNLPTITDNTDNATTISNLTTGTYTMAWSIDNGPFCPASVDMVDINVSAPATAGPDQDLCFATEALLTGTDGSTGTWTQTLGPAATITANSGYTAIATLTPGNNYTFQFATASIFGCASTTDLVNITTALYGTQPDAGPDQDICLTSGNSITMAGNNIGVGTGLWVLITGPNTPTFVDATSETTVVNGLIQGLYVFEWQSNNSTCLNYSDILRVNAYEPPTVADAGLDDLSACSTDLALNGNAPINGIGGWTQVSGPNISTINFPIQPGTPVTNTVPGTYVFDWTISVTGGVCPASSDQVSITIPTVPPTTPDAGVDFGVCTVGTTVMAANNIAVGTGTWINVSGPNVANIVSPNSEISTVNGLVDGNYVMVWQAVNGGCTVNDTVEFTHTPLPSASNAGSDETHCPFDAIVLNGNTPAIGVGTWITISGPSAVIFANENDPLTAVAGIIPGTYIFEWSISTGGVCAPNTDQVTFTIDDNCAPVVVNENETTNEDTPLVVTAGDGILSNGDVDNEGDGLVVTTTPLSGPNNGGIVIAPDGSYTYTPNPDFNGIDTVVVSVCDDVLPIPLCSNDTLFITVTPVNDPPVANGDVTSVNQNQPFTNFLVTGNDTDPENNIDTTTVTVSGGTSTAGGIVTINADGTINYTPPFDFIGNDTIIYQVCDSTALCDTSIVVVTVIGDSDGDGIVDSIDLDDDNDGIPDTEEAAGDSDGDGIPDSLDLDSDNDGIPDVVEAGGTDADGDGIIDNFVDADNDGQDDNVTLGNPDEDGDGLPNSVDLDADNDGTPDVTENNGTDLNGDGVLDNYIDIDNDGFNDNVDTDDNTVAGTNDGGTSLIIASTDNDGKPDYLDLDSDNDGIADVIENGGDDVDGDGHLDNFVDLDGDGFNDSVDTDDNNTPAVDDGTGTTLPNGDADMDGIPNAQDLDSDNDGILDVTEAGGDDTDGDGLLDNFTDVDNDGLSDVVDTDDNTVAGTGDGGTQLPTPNTDNSGGYDFLDIDADNDGIVDNIEGQTTIGYVPPSGVDTDGDGIDDQYDIDCAPCGGITGTPITPINTDLDAEADYLDLDSDNDGESDAIEGWDVNNDGIADVTPTGTDSDNDGLDDAYDTTILDNTNGPNGLNASNGGTTPNDFPDNDTPATGELDWREWDTDGDGIPNNIDLDDDNDGIPDLVEDANTDGDNDPNTNPTDTDGDGIPDMFDLDSDNDGIADIVEAGGTDTDGNGLVDAIDANGVLTNDTNNDGIDDDIATNPLPNPDTDGDGIVDVLDLDSDNDGITDIIEAGGVDTNGDGQVDYGTPGDPTTIVDGDGDGFADVVDTDNGGTNLPNDDADNDGIPNGLDLDSDNDGITDIIEAGGVDSDGDGMVPLNGDGTLVNDADNDGLTDDLIVDTDGDGTPDLGVDVDAGGSPIPSTDTDMDGKPDYLDIDSDNDGITDIIEAGGVDTDNDGHIDYPIAGDPTSMNDSDNDGLADVVDTDSGNTAWPKPDTDNDGKPDYLDIDADNDGIVDNIEGQTTAGYTGPTGIDSDGDGLDDAYDSDDENTIGIGGGTGTSVNPTDTDFDSTPDYLDLDSDNDGESDLIEGWDTDGDGTPETVPTGVDSDGDGLDDAFDTTILDATNGTSGDNATNGGTLPTGFPDVDLPGANDQDWREIDTDGDGISDFIDLDNDNDGIPDLVEDLDEDGDGNPYTNPTDTDGDGIPDIFDLDSDNDGIADIVEAGGTDSNNDGLVDDINDDGTLINDTDGDGLDDNYDGDNGGTDIPAGDTDGDGKPDFQDIDSDNDGIFDIIEDGGTDDDNDGLVDDLNDDGTLITDTNGDGWSDGNGTTGSVDTDGDGTPDYQDLDSDNDGVSDEIENDPDGDGQGPDDSDNDGIFDYQDIDDDNDGILTSEEYDTDNNGIADDCDLDGTPNYLDVDPCTITVPEGFSPDGDGINDYLVIKGIQAYENATIVIFNRWGNKVYESTNGYNNDWDGRNNFGMTTGSRDLPIGTYFYVLDLGDSSEESIKKGYIYLNR